MKPKPIIKAGFVVACFDGDPRFLCRDAKHGHYVVTLDPAKALTFADEADADEARRRASRILNSAWTRAGSWRTYRANSKITFTEARPLATAADHARAAG
jgi:hypothetical protein